MKILVTGANGQVGTELIATGKSYGFEMTGLSKHSLDITSSKEILKYINLYNPEIIINAAAYTNVDFAENDEDTSFAINKDGVINLAIACKRNSIPLFHISTDYVFDGLLDRPYVESDMTNPQNIYGMSKLSGEEELRKCLNNHIILRTSWVFGFKGVSFVTKMIELAKKNNNISIVHDQYGGPTSARSIAIVLIRMAKKYNKSKTLPWGTYHFSQLPHCSWFDFGKSIFQLTHQYDINKNIKVKPISSKNFETKTKRPKNSRLSSKKISELIDLDDISFWKKDLNTLISKLK